MLKICFWFSKPEIDSWYQFQEQFHFAKIQNIHFQKCFLYLVLQVMQLLRRVRDDESSV